MKRDQHNHNPNSMHSDYPTSPWTEAFHAAPQNQAEGMEHMAARENCDTGDEQRPTRDALSDIYNRR